ncbi:pirin family protein [Ramlibacter sp. PS4R-6]|uniref:pirin family protein n=1 Tax=Ramlibacter sp. PS4R-6 TaxID=3133438 RepID=UPI0030A4FDCA
MNAAATAREERILEDIQRPITQRTRGRAHGPVVRLVSPSDIGESIKPFVFLDRFEVDPSNAPMFGMHPHSGIATLTFLLEGELAYEDTIGGQGVLPAGGVEWMRASGGAWHTGRMTGTARGRGLQLWVAMPPRFENAQPHAQYIAPNEVPRVGPARVLLGRYGGAFSPIAAPGSATYLYVELKKGQRWTFTPTPGHTVAWAYAFDGVVHASGEPLEKTLAVFAECDAPIDFIAETDAGFAVASAVKHPYPLVLGYYSVHTSAQALAEGEARIARIGEQLRAEGRIG